MLMQQFQNKTVNTVSSDSQQEIQEKGKLHRDLWSSKISLEHDYNGML